MKVIFQQIIGCASMTAIEYIAQRALPTASDEDKPWLQRIIAADSLDEVEALCHEAQGDLPMAERIHELRAARKAREQAMDPGLKELLEL